jgi:hypothetical protein
MAWPTVMHNFAPHTSTGLQRLAEANDPLYRQLPRVELTSCTPVFVRGGTSPLEVVLPHSAWIMPRAERADGVSRSWRGRMSAV